MPTIDDWNAEIAKDEEESDSNREYKGRGGGRGGGRGRRGDSGGYRGRGGKDFVYKYISQFLVRFDISVMHCSQFGY